MDFFFKGFLLLDTVKDEIKNYNATIKKECSNLADISDINQVSKDLHSTMNDLSNNWNTPNGKNTVATINSLLEILDEQLKQSKECTDTLNSFKLKVETKPQPNTSIFSKL